MATLYDQLEKLQKDAGQEVETQEDDQEEDVEEAEQVEEPPAAVEEPAAEEPEPEVKAEEAPKEEEKPDGQAFAKMRREANEAKRKAAELEQRLMAVEAAKQAGAVVAQQREQQSVDAEPNKAEDFEGWVEWQQRQLSKQVEEVKQWKEQQANTAKQQQLYSQAIQELTTYEQEFKKEAADYDDVQAHFQKKLTEAVMISNPSLSEADVGRMVAGRILAMASDYAKRGLNPIEEMYNMTKERFGYTPPAPSADAKATAPKPDLKKIAENRKRAANGSIAAGTSSKQDLTLDDVSNMSLAQFSKLTPAQLQALKEG